MDIDEFRIRLHRIGATAVLHSKADVRPFSIEMKHAGRSYWFHSEDAVDALTKAEEQAAQPTDGDLEFASWGIA